MLEIKKKIYKPDISACTVPRWPQGGDTLKCKNEQALKEYCDAAYNLCCFERKQVEWVSYSVTGVIILLHWELDAFHADLQDAGGRRVIFDCHPSVGSNLEDTCYEFWKLMSINQFEKLLTTWNLNNKMLHEILKLIQWQLQEMLSNFTVCYIKWLWLTHAGGGVDVFEIVYTKINSFHFVVVLAFTQY